LVVKGTPRAFVGAEPEVFAVLHVLLPSLFELALAHRFKMQNYFVNFVEQKHGVFAILFLC
jgi:hypothetical protein